MLCQASTSTFNPDPISRGMEPQYQFQPLPNSSTSSQQVPAALQNQSTGDTLRIYAASQRPLSSSQPLGSYDPTPYNARALPQLPAVSSSNNNVATPDDDGLSSYQYDDGKKHPTEEQNELAPTSYDSPSELLNPSMHPKPGKDSRPPQFNLSSNSATTDGAALSSLQGTNNEGPYIGFPAGLRSSHSIDINNKTPTQADFICLNSNRNIHDSVTSCNNNPLNHEPTSSVRPRSAVSAADLVVDPENRHEKPFAALRSLYSLQSDGKLDTPNIVLTDKHASARPRALGDLEQPNAIFHSATSHTEPSTTQPPIQYYTSAQPDTQRKFEEPKDTDSASDPEASLSDVPPTISPTTSRVPNQPTLRLFSFLDSKPNQSERHSRRNSQRAPSIDSLLSRTHLDRPPSPVSPQHSVVQETPAKRGRSGPVHHGTDHDFLPDSLNKSMPKRRSRSFSRLLKNSDHDSLLSDGQSTYKRRSRSISCLFKNPDINHHPAFRQDTLPAGGTDMPMHYHSEQISREDAMIPRQQATEYEPEGVDPLAARPSDARSRSRSNSKGSSFFERLSSPVKEAPVTQNEMKGQTVASPISPPVANQKKPRRASLFRSLTGQKGHDRGQVLGNPLPSKAESHSERAQQISQATPRDNDSSVPFRSESNKVHNKLQRSSTSGFQQQDKDGGKKKRFSAMGVSGKLAGV